MSMQRGFTLLELLVAMAIFAMLAVAGWQVFDSVNRARERAQLQADNLAVLQYAYLQLQQDMGQIIAYQNPIVQNANEDSNSNSVNSNTNSGNPSNANDAVSPTLAAKPFMRLDSESLSFVRFADPDPRYQSSPSLQRIEYVFADERLIRRQYTSIQGGSDSVSLDSVLLEGVTDTRWQAFLPELASRFPDPDNNNGNADNQLAAANAISIRLVPKGIAVSFTYQQMPITWQWSLAPQPLAVSNSNSSGNSNNNNDNTGNNNQSSNGSESGSGNVDNNNNNDNSSNSTFNGL